MKDKFGINRPHTPNTYEFKPQSTTIPSKAPFFHAKRMGGLLSGSITEPTKA